MPPIEAGAQAETTEIETVIEPESPEAREAFKADSALAPGKRNEILDAWAKTVEEVGELDPEEDAAKPAKQAAKPTKVAKEIPASGGPENEPEAGEEEEEAKPEAPRKLTQAENRELMQARIAQNQRFQRREQAQMQRFQAEEQRINTLKAEHSATFDGLIQAARAAEAGDFDGIAKGLGAYLKDPSIADWNKLNETALEAVQSPVYKRMRALERQQAERDKQVEEQRAQQASHAQQQAQAAEIQSWKANLHDECVSDDDPAVQALIEARPALVDALFQIQQAHYHSTAGDLLPAKDAVSQLLTNVRNDFKFWSEFFESHSESPLVGSQAPKPAKNANQGATLERQTTKKTSGGKVVEVQAPKPIVKPKVASKNISQAQTVGASALKPMSDKELKAHFGQLIDREWRQSA